MRPAAGRRRASEGRPLRRPREGRKAPGDQSEWVRYFLASHASSPAAWRAAMRPHTWFSALLPPVMP